MSTTHWDDLSRRIAELCLRLPASAGPGVLAKELGALAPDLAFREVLARGGWYRLGGVVDGSGHHIADDLEHWAETELAARDDDMAALCDDFAGRELRATRLNGRTRYLVAATGNGATDFVQIEIEELQEVACHPLFDADAPPPGSKTWWIRATATAPAPATSSRWARPFSRCGG
ncbi:MAG: hypothetical protein IPL72_01735 [Sulfuritalea sp.]|nr:hypothetical protein [Sulfuritalea sp.]